MKSRKIRLITATMVVLAAVAAGNTMWACPTRADLSTPAQVAAAANAAAGQADPDFWDQEFPPSTYPPVDGDSPLVKPSAR